MAEDVPSNEFYWDNIFIQVEDRLFCVPRCEFVQSSEIFAGMFLLPSGPAAHTEGQDREHPIVLEGYNKNEFACLLKVMYPTAGSLISGKSSTLALRLGKEEWASVLKLSTIWNMEKIREHSIHRLSSDFTLSPIEKMHLARAHKVARWMHEGVTSLVNGDHKPTLGDLATLGWETAARILWIRDNVPLNTLYFKRDDIKCAYCSSLVSLISFGHKCSSCQQVVPADGELTVPSGPGTVSGPAAECVVLLGEIRCNRLNCRRPTFSLISVNCPSCSVYISPSHKVKIKPKRVSMDIIEEMFGEEIRDYEFA